MSKPIISKENAWNIMDLAGFVKSTLPDNHLKPEAVSSNDKAWFIQTLDSIAYTANRIANDLRNNTRYESEDN